MTPPSSGPPSGSAATGGKRLAELGRGPISRALEALDEGRRRDAAAEVDHFILQISARFESHVTGRWNGMEAYLRSRAGAGEAAALLEPLARRAFTTADPREQALREWRTLTRLAGEVIGQLRGGSASPETMRANIVAVRELWRALNDRVLDYAGAVIAVIAERFGEPAIVEMMRQVYLGAPDARGLPESDRHPSSEAALHGHIFGLQGHLSGRGRLGDLEVTEFADRWELVSAPCGSGGRLTGAGVWSETSGAVERGLIAGRHDWAWNTPGVCQYCVHCCLSSAHFRAEEGLPLTSAVEPPVWSATGDEAAAQCRYIIYKTPADVPDEAYARVGLVRPD